MTGRLPGVERIAHAGLIHEARRRRSRLWWPWWLLGCALAGIAAGYWIEEVVTWWLR